MAASRSVLLQQRPNPIWTFSSAFFFSWPATALSEIGRPPTWLVRFFLSHSRALISESFPVWSVVWQLSTKVFPRGFAHTHTRIRDELTSFGWHLNGIGWATF
uniref:(northern house mosquito) hypothetical protein n=1 Tax=Culex pipiens TaxID=7175 RepID=A0A8D8CKG4_CULPI